MSLRHENGQGGHKKLCWKCIAKLGLNQKKLAAIVNNTQVIACNYREYQSQLSITHRLSLSTKLQNVTADVNNMMGYLCRSIGISIT